MDVKIGDLRDRITVERPARSQHPSTGETLIEWEPVHIGLPARIEASQTEQENARKETRATRYSVTIRFRADMLNQTDWRLIIDGESCQITGAIDPNRKRRWLVITATGLS